MKKEVTINISDGLNPAQEIEAIRKQLTLKALSGGSREVKKMIGDSVEIEYLETTITIKRKGAKPIELVPCNVCGCDYQNNYFKPVFTNYGGKRRMIKVCCTECQDTLIEMCGDGRASKKKSGLKPLRTFN